MRQREDAEEAVQERDPCLAPRGDALPCGKAARKTAWLLQITRSEEFRVAETAQSSARERADRVSSIKRSCPCFNQSFERVESRCLLRKDGSSTDHDRDLVVALRRSDRDQAQRPRETRSARRPGKVAGSTAR